MAVDTNDDKTGITTGVDGQDITPDSVTVPISTGGYYFGDGDTKFYEFSDDVLAVFIGGTDRASFQGNLFRGAAGSSYGLNNEVGSTTNPQFSTSTDVASGMGIVNSATVSLIITSIERFTVNTSGVLNKVNAGVTADTGSSQGDGPITAKVTEISVCANAGDAVTLPTALAGMSYEATIINNGAQACDVFPASSDNLGAGVDTASSLAAGANITYVSYDDTNWIVKT